MIRKNTFTRNARRDVRRAENETSMRSRTSRFRRYEEDEKADKEENLIDVAEVSDIVDKAVDALGEYGISEIEYEEDKEPPENEAICNDEDGNEVNISVNADDAKLSIELDEENTIEIDLNAPEKDVDEALSADLEEIFNPEDEGGEDKEDKKDDAKERRIRRRMEQRMAEFQRRQAQKRRVEAIRRVRADIERQDRRDEERKPRVGNLRRREDRRDEERKPVAGRRVRRPMGRR